MLQMRLKNWVYNFRTILCKRKLGKQILLLLILWCNSSILFSQLENEKTRKLQLKVEIRPRFEVADNHRIRLQDTIDRSFFVTQRNRLDIDYVYKQNKFVFSPQLMTSYSFNNSTFDFLSLNFYELFWEKKLKNTLIRTGRQGFSLFNGRLFSDAPWAQQSRAHEGIRIVHDYNKYQFDFSVFTTRKYKDLFFSEWSSVGSHRYKVLLNYKQTYRFTNTLSVSTLSSFDLHENSSNKDDFTLTNGCVLNYKKEKIEVFFSGNYQFGENSKEQTIHGYYLNPEIKYTRKKTSVQVGMEWLSGTPHNASPLVTNNFYIRYGVAWKFMGNMNLFTQFPRDNHNLGLIDPYLFLRRKMTEKFTLRSDVHFFFTQFRPINTEGAFQNNFLGFENDWSVEYKMHKSINIRAGFSYLLKTTSMSVLNRVNNEKKIPYWSYVMISYCPEIEVKTKNVMN
jgi:hypothetical protein